MKTHVVVTSTLVSPCSFIGTPIPLTKQISEDVVVRITLSTPVIEAWEEDPTGRTGTET